MEFKIPLRNKYKEITDYSLVSKDDYDILNKYKWHKNNSGYAQGNINKKSYLLHRYVIIDILNNDIKSHNRVDHIDNNRLNNKRDNLRIVTNSENSRNTIKRQNATSNFIGVHFDKSKSKWISSIKINDKVFYSSYKKEEHAAYQYNLWCIEFNLSTANLNIIPENLLNSFILYKKKQINDLPNNIYLTKSNKYNVTINNKSIGNYDNLNNALIAKENKLKEIEDDKNKKILDTPIKKNNDGNTIIEVFNINKEKISEFIVDDCIYHHLIKYQWSISHGYITNSNIGSIHRYIMKVDDKTLFVDHINNNKLDNRKHNLRITTCSQNAKNKSSAIGSSSKYIGVSYFKINNKWRANIKINGKYKHLGLFANEIDAAKCRDLATKKYFGEFGNLNFNN
jgi:hypothetical protein